ncbi:MAG: F0F1 ATP synthase subunit delta [Lachnospiraceae bacterium]|nr:F0F1 ATP synthase subunit delta [Lachnospiraceae bacterium]MBQ9936642.1 F0F1 ATP synthase subunit delta [Lachnospiraceae bacterium]
MAKQVDITYGNALFELALEEGKLDSLYEEAILLIQILEENEDLIKLLGHPQVSKEEKLKIVTSTFDGKASDELTGLMAMVVEKGHIGQIIRILNYFIKQVKKEKNIGVATVASAVELTDAQKKAIEQRLIETTVYDTMEIGYSVDKSLIGGLVIRIEDRVVDSSIKTKLENMSRTLANA